MSGWRWAREEFVRPVWLLAIALISCTIWYGVTHGTWLGGFVFATGGAMFDRQADRVLERWGKHRRERRTA